MYKEISLYIGKMNKRTDAMIRTAQMYREKYYTRAPEAFLFPTDLDRTEFREIAMKEEWWNVYTTSVTPEELDVIVAVLIEREPFMKNIVCMSILEYLWAIDNNGETVNRDIVAWFTAHKFSSPKFSWERPRATPKDSMVIETPMSLKEYIGLQIQIEDLEANIRTEELLPAPNFERIHFWKHEIETLNSLLEKARAQHTK